MFGIYSITDSYGDVYYGSAGAGTGFQKRWREHRNAIAGGYHTELVQLASDVYGSSDLVFKVEQVVDMNVTSKEELLAIEQSYIDRIWGTPLCLNSAPKAGSCLGVRRTKAQREKIKGIHNSNETRSKHSAAAYGFHSRPGYNERHRAAIKASYTPELLAKKAEDTRTYWERKRRSVALTRMTEHLCSLAQ